MLSSKHIAKLRFLFETTKIIREILVQAIDSTFGLGCTLYGNQYCEILRSLMCVNQWYKPT